MKLHGEIIGLSTEHGLRVEIQAQVGRADWHEWATHVICLAPTDTNQRTFYMGREVTLEIRPKRKAAK